MIPGGAPGAGGGVPSQARTSRGATATKKPRRSKKNLCDVCGVAGYYLDREGRLQMCHRCRP